MRRLILLAVAMVGCQSSSAPMAAPTPKPVAVEVAHVERREVDRELELPGDLRARREASIHARVPGHLKELRVDIGSQVQAGDLLARLDTPERVRDLEAARLVAAGARSQVADLAAQASAADSQGQEFAAEAARARLLVQASQSELAQAQAQLRLGQATYDRLKAVYDQDDGLIARQELDQARTELEVSQGRVRADQKARAAAEKEAQALQQRSLAQGSRARGAAFQRQGADELAQARQKEAARAQDWLAYTVIRAPFAGVVTHRYLFPGDMVPNASSPIVDLADDRVVTVKVRVPELEAPYLHPGTSLVLSADALPGQKFSGRVTRVARALEVATDRAMPIEADLPNPGHKLQPGMFVRVTLARERHPGVLAVPTSAVLDEKGKRSVFVISQGKVVKTPVTLGFSNPRWSELQKGLNGGEAVVSKGKENLSDGASVEVR